MSIVDDILLEKRGLTYDELSTEEREVYNQLTDEARKSVLTMESFKSGVVRMREAIQMELVDEPEFNYIFIFKVPNRKQIYLKARLKNLILIEAILIAPEKVKEQIEQTIGASL